MKHKYIYPISLSLLGLAFMAPRLALAQQPAYVEVCGENNTNCYAGSQIVVGFTPSALLLSAVDNTSKKSGTLSEFLTPTALSALSSAAGFSMGSVTAYKLAPEYTSGTTNAPDAIGEQVPQQKFWTTFLLVLPPGVQEQQLCNQLRPVRSVMDFAHLNWTLKPHATANDPLCPQQKSLHTVAGANSNG